jgi:hypothetical protein
VSYSALYIIELFFYKRKTPLLSSRFIKNYVAYPYYVNANPWYIVLFLVCSYSLSAGTVPVYVASKLCRVYRLVAHWYVWFTPHSQLAVHICGGRDGVQLQGGLNFRVFFYMPCFLHVGWHLYLLCSSRRTV